MTYQRADFSPFSVDAGRVIANLETAYEQVLETERALAAMPSSMYWQNKSGTDYLAQKRGPGDSGSTVGVRSPETEQRMTQYADERQRLRDRQSSSNTLLVDRARQYRALRLPQMLEPQARLLRELDRLGLLGVDYMVVGTNAFSAYELLCAARFPAGNEETEDFDLAWCRDTHVSLAQIAPSEALTPPGERPTLLAALKKVDATFTMSKRKPYQAVNADGYEVKLVAAPSTHPMPRHEVFAPLFTLPEQEWLLEGVPVRCVVSTPKPGACPLYVPDPRWMAVHKLWLSRKPERNPAKKGKDARQGSVLLDAARYFLQDSYPLDVRLRAEPAQRVARALHRMGRGQRFRSDEACVGSKVTTQETPP